MKIFSYVNIKIYNYIKKINKTYVYYNTKYNHRNDRNTKIIKIYGNIENLNCRFGIHNKTIQTFVFHKNINKHIIIEKNSKK